MRFTFLFFPFGAFPVDLLKFTRAIQAPFVLRHGGDAAGNFLLKMLK